MTPAPTNKKQQTVLIAIGLVFGITVAAFGAELLNMHANANRSANEKLMMVQFHATQDVANDPRRHLVMITNQQALINAGLEYPTNVDIYKVCSGTTENIISLQTSINADAKVFAPVKNIIIPNSEECK